MVGAVEDGLHVVVGASGGTGRVVVRELRAAGRRVRAVNRSGRLPDAAGVEVVAADAGDAAQMRRVCAGAAVVYHCVNPPFLRWRELFPATVDGVLAGAAAAGAVVVFADDTWMYGRVTAPMTEETPHRPVSAKGVLRAWLAERVLAAHHRGDVRTVIGRAGELYGPAVESVLGRNLFGAALAGRTARWFGRLDQPLTPAFIDDFGRGLVTLAAHPEAYGAVWHVPHPEPTTGGAFVDAIFAAAGTRSRVTAHGPATVRALGLVSPVVREGAEMLYQFAMPFVVDGTRFQDAFGAKATPIDEAVRATLDWYRANPGRRALGR
jgi:nucleoside-diphosphate-sugar epimerase